MRIKVMIVVAVCIIVILFVFVQIRNHLLAVNNYFINVDDVEEVYSVVASEFIIGESTKTDVEHVLNAGIFGDLTCLPSVINDPRILCYALASYSMVIPKFYLIILRFSEDVLVDIIVQVTYPNAP